MRRILFISAAILVAAACTRESSDTPGPEILESKPINVTLWATSPETRTEIRLGEDQKLHPFWTSEDNIQLVRIPDDLENFPSVYPDGYVYPHHDFNITVENDGASAKFRGQVPQAGRFVAFYPLPKVVEVDGEPTTVGGVTTFFNWEEPLKSELHFTVPNVQYPSRTSFDPAADLLISDPIDIGSADEQELSISFTRMNAILKVIPENRTGKDWLDGQTIRRVALGTYVPQNDEDWDQFAGMPFTRSNIYRYNANGELFKLINNGVAGDVTYTLSLSDEIGEPYFPDYAASPFVCAIYTDDTAYQIGDEDGATFLMTIPGILRNDVFMAGDELYTDGLNFMVETDDYTIWRNVVLPETGLVLKPSVVTTLNIGLYNDGENGTRYIPYGLSFSDPETDLMIREITVVEGEDKVVSIRIEGSEFAYLEDHMEDFQFSWSQRGNAILDLDFDQPAHITLDAGVLKMKGVCIHGFYATDEPVILTVTAGGRTATLAVTVTPGT